MERQQGKHILPKDRFRSLRQFFTTLHHKGSSVRLFTPSWQSTDQSVSPFNEHHTLHSAVLGLKLHILQKIRRLECFRLKPTLSLSIISCREDIGHSTKYNRDPTPTYFKTIWSWNPQVYGGMKCSTPGLTKLSAEHNIINARGNTHFTPQCNLSLPSSSAKSNWPLCRIVPEFKKNMKLPQMHCEGTRVCGWPLYLTEQTFSQAVRSPYKSRTQTILIPLQRRQNKKTLQPRQS